MELVKLKLKLFFIKLWGYIKTFGGFLLFAVTLIGSLVFFSKQNARLDRMAKELEEKQKAHRDNVDRLQTEIEKQIKARQDIERQFSDLMAKIKREHSEGVQQIAETRQREIRDIVERNRENPEAMATAVNTLFGIPVITLQEVEKP